MKENHKITLDEQKKIQLSILIEVKKVCDKCNINYYLGGGTLLGAIRHSGYIPWDDDIDIMMLRTDYEKLLENFNKKTENSNYKLISYKNTKNYYYPFAKIVDLRTELIESAYKPIEEMGIYIDIFPIDFLPDNDKKIQKIYKKYKVLERILGIYRIDKVDKITKNRFKLILKKPIRYILEKLRLYKLILKSIDSIGKKYNGTNTVACISGRYFEKEIMPKAYIDSYVLANFEGNKFKIPVGYDEYLAKHYGEYMKLPPKEKQIADHENVAYWK